MTKIDEEALHAAKMAFADAMTKQRIGIGSLDRDDLALVAEKTDAMLESALSAYLTAIAEEGYVIEQGWRPIETAPPYTGEVELYREDAGVFWGERTTLEESGYISEQEIESGQWSNEALEALDWWYWGPNGAVRLEGVEIPTHWRPLPDPPAMISKAEEPGQ
ncbi:hypothetical protein [Hyphomonas sp. CY54-11-8]|uniref:hypothetical protein n=1 Tax=Hyphomonas sp. CY54-11-8 TaxID=1280944 RepID=UPI000458DFA5|nr:hypothetical protein [Hyphomonas sp. CY54-11-8]KCZ47725.1 hypothetical protein HY17_04415 [Hyphomonas sp. CY54-11-8]